MMEYETIAICGFLVMVLTGSLLHFSNAVKGLEQKISQLRSDARFDVMDLQVNITKVVYDKDLLEKEQAKHEAHKLYQQTIKNLEEL